MSEQEAPDGSGERQETIWHNLAHQELSHDAPRLYGDHPDDECEVPVYCGECGVTHSGECELVRCDSCDEPLDDAGVITGLCEDCDTEPDDHSSQKEDRRQ